MTMKRVTLDVIAQKVGVSKPVVYTVLNNRTNKGIFVGKKTKDAILKIAKDLGYVPSKSSRMLLTGRSDTIGIILQKIASPFSELVSHIHREARGRNLDIITYLTDGDPVLEEHYVNVVRDGRVDGIIALARSDGSLERYHKYSSPPYNLNILFYGEPALGLPTVHFDEPQVGRLAAGHLIDIGCKRLAFFGGSSHSPRAVSFVRFLEKQGHRAPLVFTGDKYTNFFPEGKILAQQFLRLKNLPDGVFASNDYLAVALLSEALRKGLKVPRDIAIMGCDNTELCLYKRPTITSIDINLPLIAKKIMERTEQLIAGKRLRPLDTKVPVSLIVRESTERSNCE